MFKFDRMMNRKIEWLKGCSSCIKSEVRDGDVICGMMNKSCVDMFDYGDYDFIGGKRKYFCKDREVIEVKEFDIFKRYLD